MLIFPLPSGRLFWAPLFSGGFFRTLITAWRLCASLSPPSIFFLRGSSGKKSGAAPDPGAEAPWKQWILWGVLILAVAVLSAMAYFMSKSLMRKDVIQ
ncbi:MAG: DUF3999 domain-containing protein [Spirochaetales bacterium]|nr:DUF3999 domain-containing protein [Spirochaetales bacterium]